MNTNRIDAPVQCSPALPVKCKIIGIIANYLILMRHSCGRPPRNNIIIYLFGFVQEFYKVEWSGRGRGRQNAGENCQKRTQLELRFLVNRTISFDMQVFVLLLSKLISMWCNSNFLESICCSIVVSWNYVVWTMELYIVSILK